MPLPVIADVFRCALNYTSTQSPLTFHNVIHFGAPTLDADGVADAVEAAIDSPMYDATGNGFKISSCDITPLDGTSASLHRVLATGASSNADSITQGCCVVSLATAKRGRSYRGRVYLPAIQEGAQTNGLIASANRANILAEWQQFNTLTTADGAAMVVASYLHSTAEVVTGFIVRSMLATQRRRQGRIT